MTRMTDICDAKTRTTPPWRSPTAESRSRKSCAERAIAVVWCGASCVVNAATSSGCESSLEVYMPLLENEWVAGCRNGAELWRRLKPSGFRGSLRVVTEWATRRRQAERVDAESLHRMPSARTIARLMTTGRDTLSKAESVTVAAVEAGVPALIDARKLIERFHTMIRRKSEADLLPWIQDGGASLVASFANGVARDIAAVRAAIVTAWSNGQTEGQITKLKLVKRQMYGRGKIDLLQARLIGAR